MRILWLPQARRDLELIHRYYTAVANKAVADRRAQKIVHAAEHLLDHPFLGRPSDRTDGVHELQEGKFPYSLPYRIDGDLIIIILCVFDESLPRPGDWAQ